MKISAVLALLASSTVVEGVKIESSLKSTQWEKVRIYIEDEKPSNEVNLDLAVDPPAEVDDLYLSANSDQVKIMDLEKRMEDIEEAAEDMAEERDEEDLEDFESRGSCKGDAAMIKICKSYRATKAQLIKNYRHVRNEMRKTRSAFRTELKTHKWKYNSKKQTKKVKKNKKLSNKKKMMNQKKKMINPKRKV